MILRPFFTAIPLVFFLVSPVLASTEYAWVNNLLNHPNVVVKKGAIEEQYWRIQELEALRGFDVEISGVGDVPLLSNFQDDFTRDSKGQMYLDLVMSGNYTLYDFGYAQNNIDAEALLHNVKRLQLVAAAEKELNVLLTLVIGNQELMQKLAHLKAAAPELQSLKEQLTVRYEAGLGTLTDIRRVQIQLLELESNITLLENSLNQIQLTVVEQYALSSEDLVAIWHDTKYVLKASHDNVAAQRSKYLSELKVQSLMFQQASVRAQTMPSVEGALETRLYDVTRSLGNYKLSGQVKLKMPIYDNGYSEARVAKLNQATLSEVEASHQLQRQKQNQLSLTQRQQVDVETRTLAANEKLDNLAKQLHSLKQALGNTSSDVNGVGSLVNEIATTQVEKAGLQADAQRNNLEKLLITEQLLEKLAIDVEDYL
ncbi:MAG: TolC family protein [Gammaproteobacteria bacterium]|jgi:adhesin transport system outer membrane protein|nr:TolC family protein [Gammaproteobacteria bacterium]MDP6166909.1 TolC family protein [Gammaproteobacteria bacterium]